MYYSIDDHDNNDFCITPILRERLSSTWINWLRRLSNPSFPPVIFQTVKGQDSGGLKLESLESLVNVLLVEQVCAIDGQLKSLPLFFDLPAIVQVRLLFIMQTSTSRLALHTLTTFCNKIERSPNMWIRELVQQLKTKLLNYSLPDTLSSSIGLCTETYQLSPESSDNFRDLLSHLKKREINPFQNIGGTTDVELSIQEREQPLIKENISHFVDVIIIDEDDDDSCGPEVDEMQRSGYALDVKHTPKKTNIYTTTSDVSHSRKESITENIDDVVGAGDASSLVFIQSLTEDVKVNLAILREACKSDSKEVTTDMLRPLVVLPISEIKEACDFLKLDQLTDKRLVNVFDNMPWADLSLTSANILLNSCLIPKLTNMNAESSHLLLEAINSVATAQPKILVDILSQALSLTLSGIYQCQFATAVIKQSLPLDTLGYLIGKLNQESVTPNEHLLGVLQTVIDRKPELDLDTLTQLFTLLMMCSSGQNSNLTLGKILLAVLSRYARRMSSKQITMACTIIDSHTSSLKRSLHTAIKKIL